MFIIVYSIVLSITIFFLTRSFYIKKVRELTLRDEETGIYNKRYFDHVFLSEFHRARRIQHPISLIFISCISGKQSETALSESIKRDTDFLAKYDENIYVAVLYDTDSDGTDRVVTRIENKFNDIQEYNVGVYAAIPDKHVSSSHMLSEAYNTLKKAEKRGFGTIEFSFKSV